MAKAKKFPLRIWLTKKATATSHDLETDPVDEGWEWRIEGLAFEDETSAATEVRVWIKGHGYKHYICEQVSLSATTLYWFNDDFSLFEGEQLVFSFLGVTAGDELRAYIRGYKIEIEGG